MEELCALVFKYYVRVFAYFIDVWLDNTWMFYNKTHPAAAKMPLLKYRLAASNYDFWYP